MATRMPPGKRSRPWADLPTELVDAVVAHLDVFSAARLAAVRAPWARTVATAKPSLPFGRPCLLASHEFHDSDGEDNDDYTFDALDLGAADGEAAPRAPAVIEAFRDRFWVGGRGAWLAAVDEDCNAQLLNLYTGDHVGLPAVSTIPGVEPSGYRCKVRHVTRQDTYTYTFRKIVVCDTPSAPSGAGAYLAVTIVTSLILAVARGGDRSWTALKNHRDLMAGYDDAVVHKGRVFVVDVAGRVFAWDLLRAACSNPDPERVPAAPGATSYGESVYQWNLAESADGRRLILACTHGRYARHEKRGRNDSTKTVHRFRGDGVRLHELDVDDAAGGDGRRWRRVTSLGDRALFLGANWPLWATVSRGPPGQVAQPNCVYVAPAALFGYPDKDFDVVAYDLGDGSCRQIKVSAADRDEDDDGFVIPIWFTPTLQMRSQRAS
ncbi:hypothetical protein C2845_PM09G04590 [Panicum miliaceum]|uniref:KIB1-4 beta-propeller domain-containing protein n=1 Tax=Panicum miliaceum TaxID=4540 RepID=A0A3L6RYY8_PANMI|nr:hypothetical protein C2845_PM09G04590 [Panicum miliaceum]